MKLQRWLILTVLSGCALVSPARAATTYGKVSVAGVSLTGLSKAKATQRLSRRLQPRWKRRVRLTDGKTVVGTSRASLGAKLDIRGMLARADAGAQYVPLIIGYEPKNLQRALRKLAPRFKRTAQDARPYRFGNGIRIRPEAAGRELNIGAAVWRAKRQLEGNPGALFALLPVRTHAPRRTRADLRGITGVLASFSTRFRNRPVKRTHNMMLAMAAIDGTLLRPGAVYSQNQTVGARTQARGYRTAIIFKNGYEIPGIGGGVSQVTGTLFNAAMLAGLEIVTYRTHSRPVSYLPIGRDATVAWRSFDMRFRNNSGAPIFIEYRRQGNRITATLYGHRVAQQVKLRVISKEVGPRHIKAQLYRTTVRGKTVVKERVGRSEYKWNVGEWED